MLDASKSDDPDGHLPLAFAWEHRRFALGVARLLAAVVARVVAGDWRIDAPETGVFFPVTGPSGRYASFVEEATP